MFDAGKTRMMGLP